MASDKYILVRSHPAVYTIEGQTVEVPAFTKCAPQNEFIRSVPPKDLLRNSIVMLFLMVLFMNAKYVNAVPLSRLENEFR